MKIIHFYHFDSDPRFAPFLLYVRWKSGVTFVRRCFRDENEGTLYLACNGRKTFFTSTDHRGYTLRSCQNVCDALAYLLDNIYIRFGNKLYRQIVGIPMGTNCAPLVADLFLFFFMKEIS